ncbi:MAG: helix-turn-helix transcriptional regulator [Kiritimatiellae bacterium]|nr:helix-turn-helix transcriptional regulator [Kiritimatiellia bacterium]
MLAALLRQVPQRAHFRVHRAYNITVPPEWRFPHRRNEDLHVVFVKGGRGSYRLGTVHEALERGKLLFISNGFAHSGHQDRSCPPEIIPIRFGLYDNRTGRSLTPARSPFAISLAVRRTLEFEALFTSLFDHYARGLTPLRHAICGSLLHLILGEFLLECRDTRTDVDRRIERARDFMARHPANRRSVAGLARIAGLSPRYFSRLFQAHAGVGPAAFRVQLRCRHACYLLENTSRSVKDVALALGYPDPYAFSKQFKQVTGHSPSAFRSRPCRIGE